MPLISDGDYQYEYTVMPVPPSVNLSPNLVVKSPVKIATPQYVKFDRDKEGDAEPDQDFIKLIFF